ncbi:MAG: hypothetical protein QOD93_1811, partial [Acetobacteraceae bacterium]|nr:hypothetical protein [Acetobacteraceae bacterium]
MGDATRTVGHQRSQGVDRGGGAGGGPRAAGG